MHSSGTSLPLRAALLVLCLAALVFVVAGLRAARAEVAGHAFLTDRELRSADVTPALESFRDAQRLNPDTSPELAEAALLSLRGRYGESITVLEDVVRSEPENADAWTGILGAARRSDPARAAEAERRLRELKPPVGG